MANGLTVALAYQDGVQLAQFHVPLSEIEVKEFSSGAASYIIKNKSAGLGVKKWSVRKGWRYGLLTYWINGRAVVPAPLPGRYDVVQQITLGTQVFQSTQTWHQHKKCIELLDTVILP